MIDGIRITMGGQEYTVPPLNFKALRQYKAPIEGLKGLNPMAMADADLTLMVEIVHAALVRNYPDLRVEDVEDLLDLANAPIVLPAVFAVSGFERAQPGEAAPGMVPSTGTSSTAS
ncbi:MAG: hypothetical protein ACOY5C_02810 [Pseudomonadota bacterium]